MVIAKGHWSSLSFLFLLHYQYLTFTGTPLEYPIAPMSNEGHGPISGAQVLGAGLPTPLSTGTGSGFTVLPRCGTEQDFLNAAASKGAGSSFSSAAGWKDWGEDIFHSPTCATTWQTRWGTGQLSHSPAVRVGSPEPHQQGQPYCAAHIRDRNGFTLKFWVISDVLV